VRTSSRIALCLIVWLSVRSLIAQTQYGATPEARPKTYGVTQTSYYRMAASEFTLVFTGASYDDDYYFRETNQFLRYSTSGAADFVASPHLPSGALITYFELDSCDSDATYDVSADLNACDNVGNCTSVQTLSSDNNGTLPCGFTAADVSGANLQVDNYRNQVTVRVNTGSGTESTRFAGVILGYVLQVSAPPEFPDFTDVPTSHPFYKYIEALYNSGITVGCGGGNFCPDNPLTRGQMAVFMAKALGLQFQ
jgi:S-layer homology domain